MLHASRAEAANGRMTESDQLLARLAQHAPEHPAVLNELGVRMMTRGAAEQARGLFERALRSDPKQPAIWSNLAGTLKALGNQVAELEAIERALQLEPRQIGRAHV